MANKQHSEFTDQIKRVNLNLKQDVADSLFYKRIESGTSLVTKTLDDDDTNGVFILSASSITLPTSTTSGWNATFILGSSGAGGTCTIVTGSGAANGIVGNTSAGVASENAGTITFVAEEALKGDRVDIVSDGTTFYAYGQTSGSAFITFT